MGKMNVAGIIFVIIEGFYARIVVDNRIFKKYIFEFQWAIFNTNHHVYLVQEIL